MSRGETSGHMSANQGRRNFSPFYNRSIRRLERGSPEGARSCPAALIVLWIIRSMSRRRPNTPNRRINRAKICWGLWTVWKQTARSKSLFADYKAGFVLTCSSCCNLCSYNLQHSDATPRTPMGELTALPRPPGWILGRGREKGNGWERKRKGRGKKKGNGKGSEREKEGEMRRRQTEREGRKRERKEKKETGGILCFFLRKTLLESLHSRSHWLL